MTSDPAVEPTEDVLAALDRFDRAFADGDANALAECFTSDATLLIVHAPAIEGRDAIRERWAAAFARHDTSAWRTQVDVLDRHGDRAYTLTTYTETLVPREPGPWIDVRGRLIRFLRIEDGQWRVSLVMNSHSEPMRERPPDDPSP
jgi:uncharacterized protein (TIGR02246 family)